MTEWYVVKTIGITLGTLNVKLHTLYAVSLYLPVKWQWSLTLFFTFSKLLYECFSPKLHNVAYWCDLGSFLFNSNIFFFKKFKYICSMFSQETVKLFHTIFTPVEAMLVFYLIKYLHSWHWIFAGNVFSYFCCWLYFQIFCTSIYFF